MSEEDAGEAAGSGSGHSGGPSLEEGANEGRESGETSIGEKVNGQLGPRGWTEQEVREAVHGHPTGSEKYDPNRPEAHHTLRFKLDHPMGALQYDKIISMALRAFFRNSYCCDYNKYSG